MKPSICNYALAYTSRFSEVAGVICALGLLLKTLHAKGMLAASWGVAVWIGIAAIPTAVLGWIFGILFLWQFLGRIASWLQGAPFRVGDRVWILAGEHKDTLTHVYEVWEERGQVRVELGPDAAEKVNDVFCIVAVCRARDTDPDGPMKESQQIQTEVKPQVNGDGLPPQNHNGGHET